MTHFRFKVCLFGDGGVGKTTLTQRYLTGLFEERYQLTIGIDFYIKKIKVDDDEISIQLWDFAGEERFRFLMGNALIGAHAVIMMYDITRMKTLENLNIWYERFCELNEKANQEVISLIVGSKLDIAESRTVSKESGLEMARKHGAVGWVECSSKTGKHVEEIFEGISRILKKTLVAKKKVKPLSFIM